MNLHAVIIVLAVTGAVFWMAALASLALVAGLGIAHSLQRSAGRHGIAAIEASLSRAEVAE